MNVLTELEAKYHESKKKVYLAQGSTYQRFKEKVEFGTRPWKMCGFLWAVSWASRIPHWRNISQKQEGWNSPVFRRCHSLSPMPKGKKNVGGNSHWEIGEKGKLGPGIMHSQCHVESSLYWICSKDFGVSRWLWYKLTHDLEISL